ncbi:MAG: creatininase family protein [Nannocystaceae bacterium]|nr:creatininase family protein [Nannocystaceae bacterium]
MTLALFDLPHHEARARLRDGAPVYLGVDPVEYHGPHLSLHNDRLLSRGCIAELGARLQRRHGWEPLLADHLELGVEPCPGPGSRGFGFDAVREAVRQSCRALLELGATRIVLVTFHGSPLHNLALHAGVELVRQTGARALAPFCAVLHEMLAYDSAEPWAEAFACIDDPVERDAVGRELRFDFHAGFFETSLALHWAPSSVSPLHRRLPPCPHYPLDRASAAAAATARALRRETLARELEFAAHALGWATLRPFPGYTGRPHLARAQAGAAFARHLLDRYEALAHAVLVEGAAPPQPIARWARWATAGGRLIGQPVLGIADVTPAPEPV